MRISDWSSDVCSSDLVTFNAITKEAVTQAMKNPRDLDEDLIDAYRARRALDYLVGFTLSPVLWRKLPGAKSAGRVQSVSLRLVVEREREIEAFVKQQYWSVTGLFELSGTPFKARSEEHTSELQAIMRIPFAAFW